MTVQEMVEAGNKGRTGWAIYTRHYRYGSPGDKYVGSIRDRRTSKDIAEEICRLTKRNRYEIKIGAIIIL